MDLLEKWKMIDTRLLCSTEFVSVFDDTVILPSGREISFTKINLKSYVSVLPLIENNIMMIEILRYPRNCLSLEIPSGHIETGETPEETAFRELKEETGYSAEQIVSMGYFHPLARSTQQAHLFLATNLKKGMQKLEATEQITVKFVLLNDIKKLLTENKITHPPTIIALQRFLLGMST